MMNRDKYIETRPGGRFFRFLLVIFVVIHCGLPVFAGNIPPLKKVKPIGLEQIFTQWSLFEAVKNGDLDGVKKAVANGADVNDRDPHTLTPLHWAAVFGYNRVVEFLLDTGAEIDAVTIKGACCYSCEVECLCFSRGESPLLSAVGNGQEETVNLLLGKGANHKIKTVSGSTFLHQAAEKGMLGIIKKYLAKPGAYDVNVKNDLGETPLFAAASEGHANVCDFLLARGAALDVHSRENGSLLHAAAKGGVFKLVKQCIKKGLDINGRARYGDTPLYLSAKNGHKEISSYLLKHNAGVFPGTSDHDTVLQAAAQGGDIKLAALCLKKGIHIDSTGRHGNHVLYQAIRENRPSMFRFLIKQGADIDKKCGWDDKPLICHAASYGRKDMVELLIKKKAGIFAVDRQENSLLHAAAEGGLTSVVQYCLEKNFPIDKPNKLGWPPLYIAARNGKAGVFFLLIKKGAAVTFPGEGKPNLLHAAAYGKNDDIFDFCLKKKLAIDQLQESWKTSLYYEILENHPEAAHILIDKGADVNLSTTKQGVPPLLKAIEERNPPVVKFLLQNGADVTVTDGKKKNALHYAVEYGWPLFANYLTGNGLNINTTVGKDLPLLYYAVLRSSPLMVDWLLRKGADITVKTPKGQTVLHAAARTFNLPLIKLCLEKGIDINVKDSLGHTPLMALLEATWEYADIPDSMEMRYTAFMFMVKAGANIKIKDRNNTTLLHFAAKSDAPRIARFLLDKGLPVDGETVTSTPPGQRKAGTPLVTAAGNNRLEMVRLLLSKGADINANKGDYDKTALHRAVEMGYTAIADYLIKSGARLDIADRQGRTPVYYAVSNSYTGLIRLFVSKGETILVKDKYNNYAVLYALENGYTEPLDMALSPQNHLSAANAKELVGSTLLHSAVTAGSKKYVQYCLDKGVSIDARDRNGLTPLFKLFQRRRFELAPFLLEKGADVNAVDSTGNTPVFYAAAMGNLELFQTFAPKGADLLITGKNGQTLLHAAAKSDNIQIATILLEKGIKVDARDKAQNTPLHIAANSGSIKMVRLFIDKGADIHAKTSDKYDRKTFHSNYPLGSTALHKAAKGKHPEIVKLLLDAGARVDTKTADGDTALFFAIIYNSPGSVGYLLAAGANTGLKGGHRGYTPIYYARDVNIAAKLVKKGAKINTADKNGWTPLHEAAENSDLEMVKFLIGKGADINAKTTKEIKKHKGFTERYGDTVSHGDFYLKYPAGFTPLDAARKKHVEDYIKSKGGKNGRVAPTPSRTAKLPMIVP